MESINKLINRYDQNATRKEDDYIKANLELVKNLAKNIENSEDLLFIEKIIDTFCEIVEVQRDVIGELESENAFSSVSGVDLTGAKTGMLGYVPARNLTAEDIPWDEDDAPSNLERLRERNPYIPPESGFEDDDQVREAFANYLKFHVEKKDGTPKMFSDTTVYDYCSRIKVLWQVLFREWQEGNLEGKISQFDECIQPGCTFLNAYYNTRTLKSYIKYKKEELSAVDAGVRAPFTKEEMLENPLNNVRNLSNTNAALEKFIEFKR